MNVVFRQSFERDLKKLRGDATLFERVKRVIEHLETAGTLREMASVKRMHGWDGYYRVRIGDYRLGLKLDGDTVEVLRFLHRKDIYRYFP